MEEAPIAILRHVDLARIAFGVSNELGNSLRWNGWINHHEKRDANNASNWRDVAEKKETKVVVQRRVDRRRSVNHEERIAVWRRLHDCLGSDIGAVAGPILNDEWLAKALGEMLADQAAHTLG